MSGLDIMAVEGIRCRGKQLRELRICEMALSGLIGYICDMGTWWCYTNCHDKSILEIAREIEICVGGKYIPLAESLSVCDKSASYRIVYVEDIEVLFGKENYFRYYHRKYDKYEEYRIGCSIDKDYNYYFGALVDVVEVRGGVSEYRKALSYFRFSRARVADLRCLGKGVFELTQEELYISRYSFSSYYIVDESIVEGKDSVELGGVLCDVIKCCDLTVIGLNFTESEVRELEHIISRYLQKKGEGIIK